MAHKPGSWQFTPWRKYIPWRVCQAMFPTLYLHKSIAPAPASLCAEPAVVQANVVQVPAAPGSDGAGFLEIVWDCLSCSGVLPRWS